MPQVHQFTVNLHPQPEGGYTVLVPALPEVVTEGGTREEAMANAREAIEVILEVYREEGWEIPKDVKTEIAHLTIAA
jgi:antitoxin HicB